MINLTPARRPLFKVLSLFIVLTSSMLSACGDKQKTSQNLYNQALASSNPVTQIKLLTESIADFPSYQNNAYYSRLLAIKGEWQQAEKAVQQARNHILIDREDTHKHVAELAIIQGEIALNASTHYPKNRYCEARRHAIQASLILRGEPAASLTRLNNQLDLWRVNNIMEDTAIACDMQIRVDAMYSARALGDSLPEGIRAMLITPKIRLSIPFANNSRTLGKQATEQSEKLARALVLPAFKAFTFKLTGHTDSRGPADYNKTLSQDRAQAVVNWLNRQQPQLKHRLQAIGMGEHVLLKTPEQSEQDYALNRRVEVELISIHSVNRD